MMCLTSLENCSRWAHAGYREVLCNQTVQSHGTTFMSMTQVSGKKDVCFCTVLRSKPGTSFSFLFFVVDKWFSPVFGHNAIDLIRLIHTQGPNTALPLGEALSWFKQTGFLEITSSWVLRWGVRFYVAGFQIQSRAFPEDTTPMSAYEIVGKHSARGTMASRWRHDDWIHKNACVFLLHIKPSLEILN